MRAVIEATLVLTLSLVVTLLILAAIFARHPLGAIDTVLDDPDISPAVFVRGEHDRPEKSGDQRRTETGAAEKAEECPYLAALPAATACPAAPESPDRKSVVRNPVLFRQTRPSLLYRRVSRTRVFPD